MIRSLARGLGGLDLALLLAGLIVVGGAWVFLEIADEVVEGETETIDAWVVRALRTPSNPSEPIGPAWLKEAVRDLTALGGVAVLGLVTATVVGFLAICRQWHAMGLVIVAILGGLVLSLALKGVFARPRPELVPYLWHVGAPSFPSGHSMLSAVVYLTLGALLTRLVERWRLKLYVLAVAMLLSFLVGLSRIYLGVHYPTDVLAGWSVGLAWATLCWMVTRYLQRRGALPPSQASAVS